MPTPSANPLALVLDYHEQTKHRPGRYAAALGYLDWACQPDPFRRFDGAARLALEHPALPASPSYDSLFEMAPPPSPPGHATLSRLFYYSLALSAWKQVGRSEPWSLRVNPSSGALHPTEAYLLCGPTPGLCDEPGLFHYAPYYHALEQRCRLTPQEWNLLSGSLPEQTLLLGLSSIHWRESWKYGERAFRYCNHDLGHALGTLAFAARTLGWSAALLSSPPKDDLALLLGTDRQKGPEAEEAEGLLAVFPGEPQQPLPLQIQPFNAELKESWVRKEYLGHPNPLSPQHHPWPSIERIAQATRTIPGPDRGPAATPIAPARPAPPQRPAAAAADAALTAAARLQSHAPPAVAGNPLQTDRGSPAAQLIRQRRSAVEMDGRTTLNQEAFFNLLHRTIPRPGAFPFSVLPWAPKVALALFVHRVEGLEPGLYLLPRAADQGPKLRAALQAPFQWRRPPGCPPGLDLQLLQPGSFQRTAQQLSCGQEIAGAGVFSLGMLAEFESVLRAAGPGAYPRLFWETGLLGQVLYLEAEAAGLRGTGIGCFFDDEVHSLLGIADRSWQSLYHFTIGGPREDPRLRTIPSYQHLSRPGK